jgi:predicted DNA-binding protein
MAQVSPTISIRLPDADRVRLDKAVKQTRRSRSFIMKEALDRHLAEIVQEQTSIVPKKGLEKLLSLAGSGVNRENPRTIEEIDAHIRWLRADE